MGRELSLLERLAASGQERGVLRSRPSAEEDIDARMESVRRNIIRLLNARQGMSETAPDYGMPALADLLADSADVVHRVQEAIRTTIDKYEPRLRQVRVSHSPAADEHQTLVFRIDGMLTSRSGNQRVWYQTAIAPGGNLEVSG
jgi:type VI secretion system protein